LNGWADFTNFIEKESPAVGQFEWAFFARVRAREAPFSYPNSSDSSCYADFAGNPENERQEAYPALLLKLRF
jgi:hypothetical protein